MEHNADAISLNNVKAQKKKSQGCKGRKAVRTHHRKYRSKKQYMQLMEQEIKI